MRDMIIVHCSSTLPHMDIGVKEIKHWHVNERGWSDIGYHLVIKRDGSFENGRPLDINGAHAKGYNHRSIGICLVGGMKSKDEYEANFTLAQYDSLKHAVKYLKSVYPIEVVLGHRDLPGVTKTCPCFNVAELLGE